MTDRPVAVIALGGTVSMTGEGGSGVTPTLDAQDLVASVPGLADGPPLRARSPMRKPGAQITFDDLERVAAIIGEEIAAGAAGAVVVQGTDTLEETAFALDVLWSDPEPVVVTGAMRNPTQAGADGPANLLGSVLVAAESSARDRGVLVVMNDTIHAASRVQKRHSFLPDAFVSPDTGPLGWVREGHPVFVGGRPVGFELPGAPSKSVRVPLMTVTLDMDEATVRALTSDVDGLVIEAFGVGHVPPVVASAAIALACSVPVVFASRTRAGSTFSSTYGFEGSERHLLEGGLIPAGWMDAMKARVLLALALRHGMDMDAVRAAFAPLTATAD